MREESEFSQKLLTWFDQSGRHDLPWQKNISPYRVWLSETMLQQTQVATVIPYFQRFTKQLPTISALAKADLDQILHLWSGLGYYSRARNLHKTAELVMIQHAGEFPSGFADIIALPGIGRSTAGAICAIAFEQHCAILDGNVKRVLSRFHAVEGWSGQSAVSKRLWQLAEQHTPKQRVADYTQAIMDLGATVCKRGNPDCSHCPLQAACQAYQQGREREFPHSKPKKNLPKRSVYLVMLQNQQQQFLLVKRPPHGIWGGLWSFIETRELADLSMLCQQHGGEYLNTKTQPTFRHTFSHFHLDITPVLVKIKQQTSQIQDSEQMIWYDRHKPPAIGLAAPVKKLLESLQCPV